MTARLSLTDLPADPDTALGDPGTEWHPRPDKDEVRDEWGHLRDLSDDEVAAHTRLPEAGEQLDAGVPLDAEDSWRTPPGEV